MYKNWASDPEVTKYLTWQAHSSEKVSKQAIKSWLKQYSDDNYYHWAIVLKDNGDEPIGGISVVLINEDVSMVHTYTFEQIYFHIMSFRDVDTDTVKGRKTLVDHFVNSIVVYDDKILINLNYKKGSKQISFKEIENSGLCSGSQSFFGPSSEWMKSLIYNGFSFFVFVIFTPWTLFEHYRLKNAAF